jgi:uncharacterized membrane protein
MKDLFEMTAGTSTGSIVAAALSYPKTDKDGKRTEDPLYWAKEIIDIYSLKGNLIFKMKSIGNFAAGFWLVFFVVTFGLIGYTIGYFTYTDPEIQNAIEDFKKDLENQKKSLKNKPPKFKFSKTKNLDSPEKDEEGD